MKQYVVNYQDPTTGAISPVDTVIAPDDYTIEKYLEDCEYAGFDFSEFQCGEFSLEAVPDTLYRVKAEYIDQVYGNCDTQYRDSCQANGIPAEDLAHLVAEWGNIAEMLEEI